MFAKNNVNINDQELQSLGIKLKSKYQNGKIIIEGYNLNDQLQYVGEINLNSEIINQEISKSISIGKFQEMLNALKKQKNYLSTEITQLKNQLIQLEKSHEQNNFELIKIFEQKIENVLFLIKKGEYQKQLVHHMSLEQEIKMKEQKTFDLTPLGLQISQVRWSRKFSTRTKVIGNMVSQLQQSKGFLSVLQTGFSKEIKKKQLWALKIKSQIDLNEVDIRADFGITLIENKDYDLQQIGHGRYGITLNSYCFSHSHEDFNCVFRSFDIDSGDVIYMEYDPIEWKMKFQRNQNGLKFEMPITPPPENDAYHPYFELQFDNKVKGKLKIELILPGRLIS